MEEQQVVIWSPGDIDPASITSPEQRQIAVGQAISYARQMLVVSAKSYFELGRCLLFLAQVVTKADFRRILSDELEGMTYAQAHRYIAYYEKVRNFPALKDFGERSFSKAICLLNTLENEELTAIDEGAELIIDKLDMMSVRDLKRELNRLRSDMSSAVREETKALEVERDALIDDRDALMDQLKAVKKAKDRPVEKIARQIITDLESAITAITGVADSLDSIDTLPPALASQVETAVYGCAQAGARLWSAWQVGPNAQEI